MTSPINNSSINPLNSINQKPTKPPIFKYVLAATGAFVLATPLIRSVVVWNRLPIYAMGSYGCALAAAKLWSMRQSRLNPEYNAPIVVKKH